MTKPDITIEVNAKLNVNRKTAETCLRLVESFCNENGVNLIGHRDKTGEVSFEFECRKKPKISPETMAAINAIGRDAHGEAKVW